MNPFIVKQNNTYLRSRFNEEATIFISKIERIKDLEMNTPFNNLSSIENTIEAIESVNERHTINNDGIGLLKLVNSINHLGSDNVNYILDNVNEYVAILSGYVPLSKALTHIALNSLITVNIYRKVRGLPHKLPKMNKRKYNAMYNAINMAVIKHYGKK